MNDMSKAESMRATREARDRVASSPRSSKADAMEAALKRYLSAEQYHQLAAEEESAEEQEERQQQR